MALTKWGTGSVSGLMWNLVDHQYVSFFGWVLIFSIPPVILAWLAPFPHDGVEEAAQGGKAATVGAH